MLRLHNTLSNTVEEFHPLEEGVVRFYTCGPTVYDYAHVGNFRTFVFQDLLRKYLKYRKYRVIHVMNITDVDDKTIQNARDQEMSLKDYTAKYTESFLEDSKTLRIDPPDIMPRATEHIPEMVALIRKLEEKGFTYNKEDPFISASLVTPVTESSAKQISAEPSPARASTRTNMRKRKMRGISFSGKREKKARISGIRRSDRAGPDGISNARR